MAIVDVVCLVSAALAVGWHGHARVTRGSDRCWSGWTAVAFGTPAAVARVMIGSAVKFAHAGPSRNVTLVRLKLRYWIS